MDCTKLNAEYTNAIYAAGGQPMILPVVAEPPTELLTQMDGLLLTGHPAEPQGTPEKKSPSRLIDAPAASVDHTCSRHVTITPPTTSTSRSAP